MIRAALLILLVLPIPAWTELGGSATGGGVSNSPSWSGYYGLSVDTGADGFPVVAWAEVAGSISIYVRRWDGAQWAELGGSATGVGISTDPDPTVVAIEPSVNVDAQNRPVVVWRQGATLDLNHVYLRRWAGSAWEELGGSASGNGIGGGTYGVVGRPVVAIGAASEPIVAWCELDSSAKSRLFLRAWDGTAWQEVGGSATWPGLGGSLNAAKSPAIACDSAGNPVVTWMATTTVYNGFVQLKRWTGTMWELLPGISGTNVILSPTVVVDDQDRPVVGFQFGLLTQHIGLFVTRWEGAAWVQLGGNPPPSAQAWVPPSGGGGGGIPSPTGGGGGGPGGNPVPNGGINTPGQDASMPRLGRTLSGLPMMAWVNGASQVYAKVWDGAAWVEVTGSATGGGASTTSGQSSNLAFSVGASGTPAIAWASDDTANIEVYFKRFAEGDPASLDQRSTTGSIPVGGDAAGGALSIDASLATGTVAFDVEIQPVGTAFTGVPTQSSSTAPVAVAGLADGAYHWRARTVGSLGLASAWMSFGANVESEADFTVGPPPPSGGGGGGGGGTTTPPTTTKGRPKRDGCTASATGEGWSAAWCVLLAIGLLRRRAG